MSHKIPPHEDGRSYPVCRPTLCRVFGYVHKSADDVSSIEPLLNHECLGQPKPTWPAYTRHIIHKDPMRYNQESIHKLCPGTEFEFGARWNTAHPFPEMVCGTRTQSRPDLPLSTRRYGQSAQQPIKRYVDWNLPNTTAGITSMSNIPTNTRGEFTNVFRGLHTSHLNLNTNAHFNTPGADVDRVGKVGTYSNLQGGWSRLGRSTYDEMHAPGGGAVMKWVREFVPATERTLYDHKNINPRHNLLPTEHVPQNHRLECVYYPWTMSPAIAACGNRRIAETYFPLET